MCRRALRHDSMTPPIPATGAVRYMGMRFLTGLILLPVAMVLLLPTAEAAPKHHSKAPDYRYKVPKLKYKKPKLKQKTHHQG